MAHRANHEKFWAHVNIAALLANSGRVAALPLSLQDVTERRKIVVVLEEARQERSRLQEETSFSRLARTPDAADSGLSFYNQCFGWPPW